MILGLLIAAALAGQQPLPGLGGGAQPSAAFAPMRMEMVLGAGVDGQPICRMAINGDVSEGADENDLLCALFAQEDGGELLSQMPPDVSLTASLTVALDRDEVPPRSLVDRGQLIFDGSARLVVDRSGRISNCQVLGTQFRGPLEGQQGMTASEMVNLCEIPGLTDQDIFQPTPDGPAARGGLLHIELFLRIGTTRTTV